ncbi:hypothetical protein JCM3774_004367 [Rhodotorula dairenensis]
MPALTATATATAAPAASQADPHADFLSGEFDPNAFAHRVLEHSDADSASTALAKLNYGVQDLGHQLRQLVHHNHPALILQAASLTSLSSDLEEVKRGLADVQQSVTRLDVKVKQPHARLERGLTHLERLRNTAALARAAHRFVVLATRLNNQIQLVLPPPQQDRDRDRDDKAERATAEAALTLAELDLLLNEQGAAASTSDEPNQRVTTGGASDLEQPTSSATAASSSIRNLDIVAAQLPHIERARQLVVERMESSLERALQTLDQPLLALSLQTAHNLSVLPRLVENLVGEMCDKLVEQKVADAFDMPQLARLVGHKDAPTNAAAAFVYKSRLRTEPTAATLPAWQLAFWARLERLVDELGTACIRVYALEKVLGLKRDQVSQESFLDEALAVS